MKTVLRADEIYYHAKAYHLMEIGSLGRGWVQFELCSVSKTNLPLKIHFTTRDAAIIDTAKKTLKKFGFDASEFTVEDDRAIVNREDDNHCSVENSIALSLTLSTTTSFRNSLSTLSLFVTEIGVSRTHSFSVIS